MSENKPVLPPEWDDPDLPEWTDEMFDIAEFRIGNEVIRPAAGYLGANGVVRGRPPSATGQRRQ